MSKYRQSTIWIFLLCLSLVYSCGGPRGRDGNLSKEETIIYSGLYVGDPISKFNELFPDMKDTLAGIEMGIFPLEGENNDLQGVMLFSTGKPYSAVENEIKNEIDLFAASVTEKYGKPDVTQRYPLFIELHEGIPAIIHIWKFQEKSISMAVHRHENDKYNSSITIRSEKLDEISKKEESRAIKEIGLKF